MRARCRPCGCRTATASLPTRAPTSARAKPNDRACQVNYTCSSSTGVVRSTMTPRLTKLELRIMEALWDRGASSVREIQEALPEGNRPAYTTVQTMVYRLEGKKAVRRVKNIGNALIFEPA